MSTTKKPTGLTITRSGMTFALEWKIADEDYGAGQQLQYKTNLMKKWTEISVGTKTVKKTLTLSAADYYPTTAKKLDTVSFRVRGKRKKYTQTKNKVKTTYTPDWSSWSDKTFTTKLPLNPTIEEELDSQYSNVTTFSWSVSNDTTSTRIAKDFEYQSRLVKECTETDGSKISWKSDKLGWKSGTGTTGSGTATGSVTITEDTTLLAAASYTRWVRVRVRGAKGASDWKYKKHVYASTYKASVKDTTATTSGGSTTVTTEWTAQNNAAHPIDVTTVEYLIATPAAGLAVPAGASWTTAQTSKDTKGTDTAKFTIGTTVGTDQCLWIRVNTQHDGNIKYGTPQLVKCGKLTAPSNLSVSTNGTTFRATVTATNNSAVPDSRIAIIFRQAGQKDKIIGIIAHGSTSATVQCPTWESANDISFGVFAFQGSDTHSTNSGSVNTYTLTKNMESAKVYSGGTVPSEPTNLSFEKSETEGEVILSWTWSWTQADIAEISWSQNENAWESTDEPQTYTITSLNANRWRVSGLETGTTWYFKVRLIKANGDDLTYGPYSSTLAVDLTSAPDKPVMDLSDAVITAGGNLTASWVYVTTDNTPQAYAAICEATISGGTVTYGNVIAHETGAQHVTIDAAEAGWAVNTEHYLCVQVTSESGKVSEWSDPVAVTVAEAPSCVISQTSLGTQTIVYNYQPSVSTTVVGGSASDLLINADTFAQMFNYTPGTHYFAVKDGRWTYNGTESNNNVIGYGKVGYMKLWDEEIDPMDYGIYTNSQKATIKVVLTTDPIYVTERVLTVMPLTLTVTGAGSGGITTVVIERAEEYQMLRPDGDPTDGYEGETVAVFRQTGDAQITIEDLIGALDDGAHYRIIAMTEDGVGQTATASIEFAVRWAHQAGIPDGSESKYGLVMFISPEAPTEYASGDVCDIYRISADKPELIVEGGTFGTVYVDPYPAIGEGVGHRIVHRTKNGDYITAENKPAWTDLIDEAIIDEYSIIVDFNGRQAILPYDVNLSNRWSKDFKVTKYLGGSQQGDWNPTPSRTATYTTALIADDDVDTIRTIRELADFSGICHIRTPEGSSYACNIDVTENKNYSEWDKVSYTLTATRVDPEQLDGQTFEEWSS